MAKAKKEESNEVKIVRTFMFIGDKSLPKEANKQLKTFGVKSKNLINDLNKKAKEWQGMRIFVEFVVEGGKADIQLKPGTTSHIIKEMGVAVQRDRKKVKLEKQYSGNISFE